MAASFNLKPVTLSLIDDIITYIDTHCSPNTKSLDSRNESILRAWMNQNTINNNDIVKLRSTLKRTKTRESKPFTTDITRLLQDIVLFPANKSLNPTVHSYKTPPPKPPKQTITTKVSSSESAQDNDDNKDEITDSTNIKFNTKTIRPVSFDFSVDVPAGICKAFWTNGAVCLRNVFDKKLLIEIRDKFDEILNDNNHVCTKWCEEYTPFGIEKQKSGRFVGINDTSRRISPFEKLVFESPSAAIAGNILGSSRIAFLFDHAFYKSCKTTTATLWHRGQPDWCVIGDQLCSIWVPFDYVPKETCLELVAGSHRWGDIIPDIDAARDKYMILSWNMNIGDCIVFHGMTVHGAPPNHLQTQQRHAMVMRFLGDDIRYDTSRKQVYPWYNFGAIQRNTYTPKDLKHGDYICKQNCDEIPVIWGDETEIEALKKEEYVRFSEEQKEFRKRMKKLRRNGYKNEIVKEEEQKANDEKEDDTMDDTEVMKARLGKQDFDRYCCYEELFEKAKLQNDTNKMDSYNRKMQQILEAK